MIRPYQTPDYTALEEMLRIEGYSKKDMGFDKHQTLICEDGGIRGFYTFRFEHDRPYLVHFCVRQDSRDSRIARTLMKSFKDIFRGRKVLLNVPMHRYDIQTIVEWYFKTKPYAEKEGHRFYEVEI